MQTNLLNYFLILYQIIQLCDRFRSFIFADIFIIFCLTVLELLACFLERFICGLFPCFIGFLKTDLGVEVLICLEPLKTCCLLLYDTFYGKLLR